MFIRYFTHSEGCDRLSEAERYEGSILLTKELIDSFLNNLEKKGRKDGTISKYRRDLNCFYDFMPDEKTLNDKTLRDWKNKLLGEKKASKTVNASISAVNSLYEYIGRKNWQVDRIEEEKKIQPELTRPEYLRLLQTAKDLGRDRLYFIIKVFCCTGISVSELPLVTVETVNGEQKGHINIHFPECLKNELMNYAERQGIKKGPIFVIRNGQPMDRTNVSNSMKQLCADAGVDERKANPRCLKKLYNNTYSEIRSEIELLAEKAYDRLIENEQLTAGWGEQDS